MPHFAPYGWIPCQKNAAASCAMTARLSRERHTAVWHGARHFFCSRLEGGLAACKALASKQGSFFLLRAVRVAVSSHRKALEPSHRTPPAAPASPNQALIGRASRHRQHQSAFGNAQHHCANPIKASLQPAPPRDSCEAVAGLTTKIKL